MTPQANALATPRVVYAGTPDFAVPALQRLIDTDMDLAAVYTQPDRRAGRGRRLAASPVKQLALDHGLRVLQPESLREPAAQAELSALNPDLMIVAAYGLILPQAVLDAPRLGCVNIHASLLPRWRGAAPNHRAIKAGDAETGVCIMQMEAGLDTGPVLIREALTIGAEETTGDLHDRLSALGARLINPALAGLPLEADAQPEDGVTYAAKISKNEARVDWTRPAADVDRLIRGLSPFPGAWCEVEGERVKLLRS
ncbi:MAG: methionyl-tRNA formyltransferase, partial [Pseudomonadota bacterium]